MANIKYEEAIRQIEEIVDRLENDDIDIDTLGPELKKAQKLIKMCKDKLTKTEEEVKKILAKHLSKRYRRVVKTLRLQCKKGFCNKLKEKLTNKGVNRFNIWPRPS